MLKLGNCLLISLTQGLSKNTTVVFSKPLFKRVEIFGFTEFVLLSLSAVYFHSAEEISCFFSFLF